MHKRIHAKPAGTERVSSVGCSRAQVHHVCREREPAGRMLDRGWAADSFKCLLEEEHEGHFKQQDVSGEMSQEHQVI